MLLIHSHIRNTCLNAVAHTVLLALCFHHLHRVLCFYHLRCRFDVRRIPCLIFSLFSSCFFYWFLPQHPLRCRFDVRDRTSAWDSPQCRALSIWAREREGGGWRGVCVCVCSCVWVRARVCVCLRERVCVCVQTYIPKVAFEREGIGMLNSIKSSQIDEKAPFPAL